MKKIILILIVLIIIINIPPLSYFLTENYSYTNRSGSFQCAEENGKGSSFEVCQRKFNYFKAQTPEAKQDTLFRTFKIQPLKFWQWGDYLFDRERFKLPYKEKPE